MLSFCDRACVESYVATPEPSKQADGRCASCGAAPRPALTSEARAPFVELHRVTNGCGPVLERALASLDRESVHALRLVVRDLEFGRTDHELRSKARRLGLGGLL